MAKRTLLMWLSLRTLKWGAYPGLSGGPPGTVSSNLFSWFFSQIWLVSSHAFMPSLGFFSALFSLLWFSVFWTLTILIYLDSQLHLLNTVCQAPHRFALPDPQLGICHKSVNGGKHKAHLFIFWVSRIISSEKSWFHIFCTVFWLFKWKGNMISSSPFWPTAETQFQVS